ncbi:hypothetical protein CHUAL_007293 [Chamberlinius hualienensis]
MNNSNLNATIAPSFVNDVASSSPADDGEIAHIGLPNGRIIVNKKWQGSPIVDELKKHVRVTFTDVGSIDYYPTENSGVVHLTEGDLVLGSSYRRTLAKLRNSNLQGYVLYAKSDLTQEWFYSVQKFVVLDLGLAFFPVTSIERAAQILIQIEKVGRTSRTNPFLVKKTVSPLDVQLQNTFGAIEGLGPIKSKQLLQHFKSIKALSTASLEELTAVIGKAAALQVWNLFQ